MTRQELLEELERCSKHGDCENAHLDADYTLLKYINDDEVTKAFWSIEKWYS